MDPVKDTLMEFLSMRLEDAMPVLSRFAELDGSIAQFDGGKNNFVYVPGNRADRVVLVAHADTVWDTFYVPNYAEMYRKQPHKPVFDAEGQIISQGGWKGWGIGADDRAGCAILWLLKESGHSLLITDGEEHGQIGAHHLMEHYPDIAAELNAHQYMIQFDRCNATEYKTYRLPVTQAFIDHVESHTHYTSAGIKARTDIVTLCRQCCGVNLSVGYYNEHTTGEKLHYPEWLHTYQTAKELLTQEQPQFLLRSE
ncbi:MAG: hypothetical protein K5695_16255 [Oscillospiraceae bacterium]|nr:hypothetical protein [Oscillospiraceae bacterium]